MAFEKLVASIKAIVVPSERALVPKRRQESNKTLAAEGDLAGASGSKGPNTNGPIKYNAMSQLTLQVRTESNTTLVDSFEGLAVDTAEDRTAFHELKASQKWVQCVTGIDFDHPELSKCEKYSTISHVWGKAGSLVAGSGCRWVVRLNNDPLKFHVLQHIISNHEDGKSVWLDVKDQPQYDAAGNCVNPDLQAAQVKAMAYVYYFSEHTYILIEQDLSRKKTLIEKAIQTRKFPTRVAFPHTPSDILVRIAGYDIFILISAEQLVSGLKERIFWFTNVPPACQELTLISNDRQVKLNDSETLHSCQIINGSLISMVQVPAKYTSEKKSQDDAANEISYEVESLSRYISVMLFDFLSGTEYRNRVWCLQEEVLSKSKSIIFWTNEGTAESISVEWLAGLFKQNLPIWKADLQDSNSELSSSIKLLFGIKGRYNLLERLGISETVSFHEEFGEDKDSVNWLVADQSTVASGDYTTFIETLPKRIYFHENTSGFFKGVQHPDTVWENYFSSYSRSSKYLKDQVFAFNKLLGIQITSDYNTATLDEIFGEWNQALIAKGYVGFGWRGLNGTRYGSEREQQIFDNAKKFEFMDEFDLKGKIFYNLPVDKRGGEGIAFELDDCDNSRTYAKKKLEVWKSEYVQRKSMSWCMDSNWLFGRDNQTEHSTLDGSLLKHRFGEMATCRREWGFGAPLALVSKTGKPLTLRDEALLHTLGPIPPVTTFDSSKFLGTFYARDLYAEFCKVGQARKYGLKDNDFTKEIYFCVGKYGETVRVCFVELETVLGVELHVGARNHTDGKQFLEGDDTECSLVLVRNTGDGCFIPIATASVHVHSGLVALNKSLLQFGKDKDLTI
ncbi:hypothetical protein HDU79_000551 [Rhizoclosmatium sp. JEL0117]|nr:hypothetical protein HDU79_000551 [Rhizoclosmatium sp. JEL0117]